MSQKSIVGMASCALVAAVLADRGSHAADTEPADPLAYQYGFLPPEIYKLDFRTQNLLVRDVTGDGREDVIVVNNLKNRIDLLCQREPGAAPAAPKPQETNEIMSDWRLDHRKVPVSRAVASLEVQDVNGDRRPDLVYLGNPSGLYIEYQTEAGTFEPGQQLDVAEAQTSVWALDIGDLTGDGRLDVVFLGKQYLYVAVQHPSGRLDAPRKFRLSEGNASIVRILDFDEDGHADIAYLSDDKEFPVRVRFGGPGGRLGAERRLAIDPPRGVSYANIDGRPGQEMLFISSLSGRLQIHGLAPARRQAEELPFAFVVYPFEKVGRSVQTDLSIADFDADGQQDVVIADSDAATVLLYRQRGPSGLDLGTSFPAMVGTSWLRGADLNGDGRTELLSLSDQEKTIAASRFEGDRLTFPAPLPVRDEPVVFEILSPPKAGGTVRLAYLARVAGTGVRQDRFVLRLLSLGSGNPPDIAWEPMPAAAGAADLELELAGRPFDMRAADADGDGHTDLFLFFLFQPPVLLRGTAAGTFAEVPRLAQAALGNLGPAALFAGTLEHVPALLVAQQAFARRMSLEPGDKSLGPRWKVLDQYNLADSAARATGVATLDLDGDQVPELALYDRASTSVVFLRKMDGLYRRWQSIKVGAFDLKGVRVADLDSNRSDDLLLYDGDKMGIIYLGRQESVLQPLASYESDIRGGQVFDLVPGDLNADGQLDILVIEPLQHHVEVVAVLPDHRLERALRWKVFEEKTFRRNALAAGRQLEPREAVIGDVDADGRSDIVLLSHDRVLVYLQDPGPSSKSVPTR